MISLESSLIGPGKKKLSDCPLTIVPWKKKYSLKSNFFGLWKNVA